MGNRARKFSESPRRWVTYRLKKLVLTILVMYRMTEMATALSTALSRSRRGIRCRYSPSMWNTDVPFVSERRICPCLVSRQNLKVIKVLVAMVSAKRRYSTRTTGTTE